MYTLGERIKHIRENILQLNQADFAEKLGFSRVATISDYEKNKRSPDITSLRKISYTGGVTIEWLLTGRGPLSAYDTCSSAGVKEDGDQTYSEDFAEVKVYGTDSPHKNSPIDRMLIPKKDYDAAPYAVRIAGDAMSPTILGGATVGVNRDDRRLISGNLYAVWLNYEGITVKRVFIYPDRVVLKPDNPAFPETAIPSKNIQDDFVIGRVVWLYQRY